VSANYWTRTLNRRLGRRRALTLVGGSAAAAAFIAACGGDNNSSSTGGSTSTGSTGSTGSASTGSTSTGTASGSSGSTSGGSTSSGSTGSTGATSDLIFQPVDTAKQAKRGGTNKWFLGSEPNGFDVHIGGAPKNPPTNLVYSNLFAEKPGYLQEQDYSDYIPDIAKSWEWSPDGLQLTVKIQPNAKWHNKPPINGRAFDIEDLVFSWDRFAAKGRDRGGLANSVNPDAPILSFKATDAETAVITLKEPTVYLQALFSTKTVGKPIIIPKETDSTFDINADMIGTGPYELANYTPSVRMDFKRFPDYYEKDFAFIEEIDAPFLLEYAQAIAQFRAGNIYTYWNGNARVHQEDILQLKKDAPELLIYSNEPSGFSGNALDFGWLPAGESPFRDERVRQAASMSWDRELYIDTLNNVQSLRDSGLPVETYWASSLSAGAGSWRLDPRSSDFGPNAKYYQHNVEEAKQLLAAAGYPNGLDVTSSYIPGPQLGTSYGDEAQILEDMLRQVGFRPTANLIDYSSEYPNYRDKNGTYEGWLYIAGPTTADDAVGFLIWRFTKAGGAGYLGFDVNGTGDGSGDPEVDSMLNKAKGEMDTDKRRAIVFDVQRYLAGKLYNVAKPGEASYFTMAWPVLSNFNVNKGDRRGDNYYAWLDDTKAPLA
jgi:peptide/nickel transport system substrate-binding protein